MSVRKLALTAVVAIGVLAFASKADAQVIYTSGYYTTPAVYSSYYAPAYSYTPAVTYSSWSTKLQRMVLEWVRLPVYLQLRLPVLLWVLFELPGVLLRSERVAVVR